MQSGTLLFLHGFTYDLEDIALGEAALHWRSSRDIDLGTEGQALASLSPGQHVVTLTATDSDSNDALERKSPGGSQCVSDRWGKVGDCHAGRKVYGSVCTSTVSGHAPLKTTTPSFVVEYVPLPRRTNLPVPLASSWIL